MTMCWDCPRVSKVDARAVCCVDKMLSRVEAEERMMRRERSAVSDTPEPAKNRAQRRKETSIGRRVLRGLRS